MATNGTLDLLIDPQFLADYVRSTYYKLSDEYQLTKFFPNNQLNTNRFKYLVDNRTAVPAAQFRAFDAEAYIVGRQGVASKEAEVAPISVKKEMGEAGELALRAYDTGNYGPVVEQIYDDFEDLTERVVTTFELLRGQVLGNAQCTVTFQDGYTHTIDYGLRNEHRVTAGTLWSDVANADVLADVNSWTQTYVVNNRGRRPGAIIISSKVLAYLMRNAGFRALLGNLNGTPSVVSLANVNAELSGRGLPTFVVIDEQLAGFDGVVRPVLPDNKAIIVPSVGQVGYTQLGVTPAFLGLQDANVVQRNTAPGVIGQLTKTNDPYARWSLVEAIGLPAIGNVNDLFIATVAS